MEPFLGQIQAFGFTFAPMGWLRCEGQLLAISQNDALFSLLGTYYGGDGRTTFALPDFRGRTVIHQGDGPGVPPATMGHRGGIATATLTIANMPAHKHGITGELTVGVSDEDANASEGNGKYLAGAQVYTDQAANGHLAGVNSSLDIGNNGGSQPFSIQNPSLAVNICMATVGVYPSRH
jgi:microcystin-dependent protein